MCKYLMKLSGLIHIQAPLVQASKCHTEDTKDLRQCKEKKVTYYCS